MTDLEYQQTMDAIRQGGDKARQSKAAARRLLIKVGVIKERKPRSSKKK